MLYIKNNKRYSQNHLDRLLIGTDITPEQAGFCPLFDIKPVYDPLTEQLVDNGNIQTNGLWHIDWQVAPLPSNDLDRILEDEKVKTKTLITSIREQRQKEDIYITISSGTFKYPCSEYQALILSNMYQSISNNLIICPTYWRDVDDNHNSVVVNDFLLMSSAIYTHIIGLGEESHRLKGDSVNQGTIDLATSLTELNQIVEDYRNYDPLSP